ASSYFLAPARRVARVSAASAAANSGPATASDSAPPASSTNQSLPMTSTAVRTFKTRMMAPSSPSPSSARCRSSAVTGGSASSIASRSAPPSSPTRALYAATAPRGIGRRRAAALLHLSSHGREDPTDSLRHQEVRRFHRDPHLHRAENARRQLAVSVLGL